MRCITHIHVTSSTASPTHDHSSSWHHPPTCTRMWLLLLLLVLGHLSADLARPTIDVFPIHLVYACLNSLLGIHVNNGHSSTFATRLIFDESNIQHFTIFTTFSLQINIARPPLQIRYEYCRVVLLLLTACVTFPCHQPIHIADYCITATFQRVVPIAARYENSIYRNSKPI